MSLDATSVPSDQDPSPKLEVRLSTVLVPRVLLWAVSAILAWYLVSEGATEAWYRWKESQAAATQPWPINWPSEENAAARGFLNFSQRALGSREREMLQFQSGKSTTWRDEKGYQWSAFLIQWDSDKRLNDTDVFHNPTICLPAVGLEMERTLPPVEVQIGQQVATFNAWEFSRGNMPVFVFTAVRREREFDQIPYGRSKWAKRMAKLSNVVEGRRGNPLETFQLVVVGTGSEDVAKSLLHQEVKRFTTDI